MITPVKKKVKRRVAKKAAPTAEQKAKAKKATSKLIDADDSATIVAEALKKMQIANEMSMKGLRDEIKKIKLSSPVPPTDWIFDIVRDEETGLISQIKASAPQAKRTLN